MPDPPLDLEALERLGVYDPGAPDAADQRAYLAWLADEGFDVVAMAERAAYGDLTSLASQQRMRPGLRSLDEFDELPVDEERLRQLARAFGLHPELLDERRFTEAEIDALVTADVGSAMFSDEETIYFARVVGASLARIAAAAMSMFDIDVEKPREEHADRIELGRAALDATQTLDVVAGGLAPLFRAHMYQTAARVHRGSLGAESRDAVRRAVGFVDLVGFTSLSSASSLGQLATLVRELEGPAHEIVEDQGGWVVKTIGDEVMFVAEGPDALSAAAAALMRHFGGHVGVEARGGLAFGDVLSRGGDYYGPVVNLAARLADVAVPGEVLASADLADRAAASGFVSSGRRQLKGFAEPVEVAALET